MEGINTKVAISSKIVDHLLKFGKEETFKEGAFVFNEGDPPDFVYIIIDGEADVLVKDAKGSMKIISRLEKGAIFGEMGLFLKNQRSASVRVTKDIDTVYFTSKEFINAISKLPAFNVNVLNVLVHRLYESNKKVANLNNYKSYVSVLLYIKSAADKNGEVVLNNTEVCNLINVLSGDLMKVLLNLEKDNIIGNLDVSDTENIKFTTQISDVDKYLKEVAFSEI